MVPTLFGNGLRYGSVFWKVRHEEGGLIYRTGSTDLWAKQFPTFLGQVLHLISSALSGGLKGEKCYWRKVQGRKPRRILSLDPFALLSPCAGFEPLVLVCGLEIFWSSLPIEEVLKDSGAIRSGLSQLIEVIRIRKISRRG